MKKVLVAMSGGVDSSIAAWLLKQQGYDCIGVTMRLYENETVGRPRAGTCCSLEDVEDARSVAFGIGIPYYVFNFTADFEQKVIARFAADYAAGRTPNPCIDCNRYLKFDRLYRRAAELGCDFIATGHYARVLPAAAPGGPLRLAAGLDESKDQSYVLYDLTQEQLAHTLFPLGALPKTEVRRLAEAQGFVNARKHDSEDICFVPEGNYAAFLERYTGAACPPGNFVDATGKVLGRHKGIIRYTVGQRKGLGISSETPLYVVGKNAADNTVTLGPAAALESRALVAERVNWPCGEEHRPAGPVEAEVCTRYHGRRSPALVTPLPGNRVQVTVCPGALPFRAPAPGQAMVAYRGAEVLCGGVIG